MSTPSPLKPARPTVADPWGALAVRRPPATLEEALESSDALERAQDRVRWARSLAPLEGVARDPDRRLWIEAKVLKALGLPLPPGRPLWIPTTMGDLGARIPEVGEVVRGFDAEVPRFEGKRFYFTVHVDGVEVKLLYRVQPLSLRGNGVEGTPQFFSNFFGVLMLYHSWGHREILVERTLLERLGAEVPSANRFVSFTVMQLRQHPRLSSLAEAIRSLDVADAATEPGHLPLAPRPWRADAAEFDVDLPGHLRVRLTKNALSQWNTGHPFLVSADGRIPLGCYAFIRHVPADHEHAA